MKDAIFWTLGIASMIALAYMTATRGGQDLVWLLVPGFGLLIAIIALTKVLK